MQLHYYPGNASFTPHVLLREIGAPFELKLVQRAEGAHKQPEYLKLNPNGLIPVLVDGELVLYETAAICMHLADAHPGAALPALGVVEDGVIGVAVAKAHLGPVDPGPEVMGVAEVGPARGGVGQRDLAGAAEAVLQATLRPLAEGDPGAAGAAA